MSLARRDARWLDALRDGLADNQPKAFDRRRVPKNFRDAGVLAPLWPQDGRLHMLFMRRPLSMPSHKGEVSFPGGGKLPSDPDLLATALREAKEEVGLESSNVEILGRMDEVWSVGKYIVRPWVGWSDTKPLWEPSPREAEELVEVPVEELMAPGVHVVKKVELSGARVSIHYYDVRGHIIWGLTGGLVHRMLSMMRGDNLDDLANTEETLEAWLAQSGMKGR